MTISGDFGKRLAQARKMCGLSLRALSHKMRGIVSYAALHKYETGKAIPGSPVLIALAEALDQNIDFFFRPLTVSLEKIEFRKRSALGAKEEEAIRQQATDFFERYLELENILSLESRFENPLKGWKVMGSADIESAALQLREAWKLGNDPLPNLLELLEDRHFKIYELDAGQEFDGLSGWAGEIPVIVLNRQMPNVRKRLTALHEVAHLLLDFPKDWEPKTVEPLCHQFGGAMLMPEPVFRAEFGGKRGRVTLNELVDIKANYGISIGAIMTRARNLGLITENHYRDFWIQYRKRNWHLDEPGEYAGQEKSNRFHQLLHRAAAEEWITLSKAAALAGQPLADFRASFEFAA